MEDSQNSKIKPLITFTSDFGVQSQGVGIMEGTALKINPDAQIIHLMHGLPSFNLSYAARTMETLNYMPVGYHVCVVDPGVGTKRKAIIIKTKRGDYLIGPDNGVLIPVAEHFLGGIEKIHQIKNEKYMNLLVSPVFHGRDIFTPAAAYLCKGIPIEKFGPELKKKDLVKAPHEEAVVKEGYTEAQIIHINHFGSLHLNILAKNFDKSGIKYGDKVTLNFNNKKIQIPFLKTFGDVPIGKEVMFKDDYLRIEIAINQGNFAKKHSLKQGDKIIIKKWDIKPKKSK